MFVAGFARAGERNQPDSFPSDSEFTSTGGQIRSAETQLLSFLLYNRWARLAEFIDLKKGPVEQINLADKRATTSDRQKSNQT